MRHSDSKKHVSECQKRGFSVDLNTHDKEPVSFENRKKIAEIKFAALIAEENIPFKIAESILSFFQDLGEDPKVLKSMTMNRNKAPKVIKNVFCVREQERLVEKLKNNKFSIFVDETSDLTNDKWMTFLIRYVDPQTLNANSFDKKELIHLDASDCSAEKLFTNFRAEMWKKQIPFSNILALSCEIFEQFQKSFCFDGTCRKILKLFDGYNINPLLACNRLSPDQVMVGEACQAFYDIAAKEIRNKLFVKDEFLCTLRIFEPKFAFHPNNSVQDVLFVAQRFGGFDEEILKEKWQFLKKDFTSEQKLCVFKSILKARRETARTIIVDARHLTLMSENLYKTNARGNICFFTFV
ncbi:hypothetical protein ALC57_08253 [Trachymyrmex cornetzi]|uniref:DUF4371 domain-containing protein n=1 Tax=Trachymyrmex cornetzi TaxID=471704 RepID=A0A151J7E4_9HYME|nr:hypothetical protein ALC57_08253 [Trachymyrmex cornetzi]